MRSFSEYKSILKKKGWYICWKELKKSACPIWFTHNRGAIEQIETERSYNYLKKTYSSVYMQDVEKNFSGEHTRIIWICWLQGRDLAPAIVQKCIASVERYAKGYEIKVLTEKNLLEYVTIPEIILSKYKTGKIQFTHFSDIVRSCLLFEHGGIWMDSTVLLTDDLPNYIKDNSFFVYRTSVLNRTFHAASNWLISSDKGHPIMKLCRDALFSYWSQENYLKDYYIFHIFFYLIVNENPVCRELFNQMPYVPNVDVHTLQFTLREPFSERKWKNIIERSSVHKLTYKYPNNIDYTNTFLSYLLL